MIWSQALSSAFQKGGSNTGDLIPGSAGHTLLSSLSTNLFDVYNQAFKRYSDYVIIRT